jgi:elongation factor G
MRILGVETQSLTVWRQANRYHVPRLIYINKMDKPTADLSMCLNSIRQKFGVEPLLLHTPFGHGKQFTGIFDLLNETIILSNNNLKSSSELLTRDRLKLIEKLADIDDNIAELLLFNDKPITNIQLTQAICRLMVNDQSFVPVLVGSSLKNLGVQALLDAIVNFLPSARTIPGSSSSSNLGTLLYIFKTIHDRQKQPLSFARIYSGSVKKRMALTNVRTNEREQINKVFLPFADNMEDIDEIRAGSIAVLSGLQEVRNFIFRKFLISYFYRHQVVIFLFQIKNQILIFI